jgi:3-oxoacyl-[acyl-carrier protein] reductase
MTSVLKDRNVFITGSTGGLGAHIAVELSQHGCNIYLTGRDPSKLKIIKDVVNLGRGRVHGGVGDLRSLKDVDFLINDAKDKLGSVDILVNCAGVFTVKPLSKSSIEDFEDCFSVNVKAPFLFSKEFIKDMSKNKWGRIVNIGSSSAYSGFKNTSVYCSSKHALLGLSRALYDEHREDNVRTFCFSPGSIKTEMGKKVKNQDFSTFIDPREIAKYIAFTIGFDGEMVSEEIRLNRVNIK